MSETLQRGTSIVNGRTYRDEYNTWRMLHRYGDYCAKWQTFHEFLADLGPKPSPDHNLHKHNRRLTHGPGNSFWRAPIVKTRGSRIFHGESPCKSNQFQATKEYTAWQKMVQRRSGVCERWRKSYPNFLADMGRAPDPSYAIRRFNRKKEYGPGNVNWVKWFYET